MFKYFVIIRRLSLFNFPKRARGRVLLLCLLLWGPHSVMFITLFYEDSVGRGPRRGRGKKWPCLVFLAVNKHTGASQKYLETTTLTLWPSLHVWNHSDFFNKRSVRTGVESQRIYFYLLGIILAHPSWERRGVNKALITKTRSPSKWLTNLSPTPSYQTDRYWSNTD